MVADNRLEEAKVNFFLRHSIPEEVIFEVSIRAEPQFRRLNDRY